MTRTIVAVLLVLPLGVVSCSDLRGARCVDGDFDGSVSRISSVTADVSRMTTSDGGVSVPIVIDAEIPCLLAGVTATVTASVGMVGGMPPGMAADVYLAPTSSQRFAAAGTLAGETSLDIPAGRSTRLEVVVADTYSITTLEF